MRKIAFLDLGGTLVESSIWHYLNMDTVGEKKNLELYEDFCQGKISYVQWVKTLEKEYKKSGLTEKGYAEKISKVKIKPKAKEFIEKLKELGFRTILITNSTKKLAKKVKKELNIDETIETNEFFFSENGKIKRVVPAPHGFFKGSKAREYLKECKASYSIAIGDSDNDVPMFEVCDFGFLIGKNKRILEERGRHYCYKDGKKYYLPEKTKRVSDFMEIISILGEEHGKNN